MHFLETTNGPQLALIRRHPQIFLLNLSRYRGFKIINRVNLSHYLVYRSQIQLIPGTFLIINSFNSVLSVVNRPLPRENAFLNFIFIVF